MNDWRNGGVKEHFRQRTETLGVIHNAKKATKPGKNIGGMRMVWEEGGWRAEQEPDITEFGR